MAKRFLLIAFGGLIVLTACQPGAASTIESFSPTSIPPIETSPPTDEPEEERSEPALPVLFLVFDQYSRGEFITPSNIIRDAGYDVVVASNTLEPMYPFEGAGELEADLLLEDVRVADYAAIVVPGGAWGYLERAQEIQSIVQDAVAQGKVLAGLCSGARVLGRTGMLEQGSVAVSYTCASPGVICVEEGVTVHRDGRLVTALYPDDATQFAQEILAALEEQGQ